LRGLVGKLLVKCPYCELWMTAHPNWKTRKCASCGTRFRIAVQKVYSTRRVPLAPARLEEVVVRA